MGTAVGQLADWAPDAALAVPVADATVTGRWNGCKRGTGSGVTDCTGRAVVDGGNVSCAQECIDLFTVTDVTHEFVLYDPDANVETSDDIFCF